MVVTAYSTMPALQLSAQPELVDYETAIPLQGGIDWVRHGDPRRQGGQLPGPGLVLPLVHGGGVADHGINRGGRRHHIVLVAEIPGE